ncbi:hypothetical protein CK203_099397 [Vitis vinifera]|uniref:Uncharacterized protein n=1 Tax=Vitis vinifera TaxID=29760 RepID=A0A438CGB9_VITVI|nr:hypothetical protein CK203_099397 [Vitis vinifera]
MLDSTNKITFCLLQPPGLPSGCLQTELDEVWCSSEVGCFADWSNLRWSLSLQSSPVADLVVRNALIYTSDAALPFADSMAVSNGRILRVGNYSSVVQVPCIVIAVW